MMADFDLSQALDTMSDEKPRHSSCNIMANTQDKNFPFDIQLVITGNHKSMQHVANLIVSINKWKKPLSNFGELTEEQRCNMVFERMTEKKSTEMLKSHGKKRVYQRVNSVNQCTLCDIAQKDLIHVSGGVKLHAITLKGGNYEQKVKFQLSRFLAEDSTVKGQPITLSITSTNLHLTCSMQDVKAVLNVEQCTESELQQISSEQNMDRFLFYKTITGASMITFESVSCPGWYISTSSEDEDQPVEMCQADSARHTNFSMNNL